MRLRGGAGAREDVRLWVTCECVSVCVPSKIGKRVCARRAPGERQAGGEQHLTRKRKVGKQDATLTQETGTIGDCLHCYPINRP